MNAAYRHMTCLAGHMINRLRLPRPPCCRQFFPPRLPNKRTCPTLRSGKACWEMRTRGLSPADRRPEVPTDRCRPFATPATFCTEWLSCYSCASWDLVSSRSAYFPKHPGGVLWRFNLNSINYLRASRNIVVFFLLVGHIGIKKHRIIVSVVC